MSINSKIEISKDKILNKYNEFDDYFRKVILSLCGDMNEINLQYFHTNKIVTVCGNNIKILKNFSNSTGVYIFLDKDNVPVYIGVAGIEGSRQPLQERLRKHFKCRTDSNLSKNIYEIETIYGNKLANTSENDKKQLILDYAPKLLIIKVGELGNSVAAKKASSLEILLISLFNSKYNK